MTTHSRRCLWTVVISSLVFVGTALYMMYSSLLDGSGLTVDELGTPLFVMLVSAIMFAVGVVMGVAPLIERWLVSRLKGPDKG